MRIRLKTPFFFQNHLYQPGEVVLLPDGVEGPHKSRATSLDKIDYGTSDPIDANRVLGEMTLEPLFDVIEDEPVPEAEQQPVVLLDKPDAEKSAAAQAELTPPDSTITAENDRAN